MDLLFLKSGSFLIDLPTHFMVIFDAFPGRLAQLVRALPSHGRGHWFESSIAHQFLCRRGVRAAFLM